MSESKRTKLNRLERDLPEGLVVDAAWLEARGYSAQLRKKYVTGGWLKKVGHAVYQRPWSALSWQQVVISLQMMLSLRLLVGGRTALELHGFAHYLPSEISEVHLYGPKPPPTWTNALPISECFVYHNEHRLFRSLKTEHNADASNDLAARKADNADFPESASYAVQKWGHWDWSIALSPPERAILELLDELPRHESFEQADKFMQSLSNLSPRRLQNLLVECHNVKVKRLFFYFADRHKHAWLKHLDRKAIDLGKGKRMLVKGGKLNSRYQITVPEDLDAHP